MISELIAASRPREGEIRESRRTKPSYPPDMVSRSENRRSDAEPGLFPGNRTCDTSVGPKSLSVHPSRRLFDQPAGTNPLAVERDPERRSYYSSEHVVAHGPSAHGGSHLCRSNTYDSERSSRDGNLSSPSTRSTPASSIKSVSDGVQGLSDHGVASHTPRPTRIASQYCGSVQDRRAAILTQPVSYNRSANHRSQFYVNNDPRLRTHLEQGTLVGNEPCTRSPHLRPDDPPDWDETPNFQGYAGRR